ncbi:MAG: MvdC/MvdD family ATP grasp protein [Vulcanimicrobiota bacterium]
MKVLIITKTDENDSVRLVSEALQARGASVIRLDTDLYPQDVRLASTYENGKSKMVVSSGGRRLDLGDVEAVYYRRFAAGNLLDPRQLGDTHEACFKESRLTLYGHIVSMDCFHLDRLASVRKADYKELQLREAQRLGIACPRTLITNDPDAVLEFLTRTKGRVITKMQSQFAIYREGEENVVFTNELKLDDLSSLDGLRFSPMMFQEMVPKQLELRVTTVGHRVFAAAIDSQVSDRAKVDWRRDGHALIDSWQPYEFPPDEAEKLLKLASWFGLNYSAADYILTPDGQLVFLEMNAAGEWFWLQLMSGLNIAEAMAEVLVDPAARRVG